MSAEIMVIYKPEGGSPRRWEIDLQNPSFGVQRMAPKAAGFGGWLSFVKALEDVNADAWAALVWVLRKESGEPNLAYSSVDFPTGLMRELDFAKKCGGCGQYVGEGTDDVAHECPAYEPDPEDADPQP